MSSEQGMRKGVALALLALATGNQQATYYLEEADRIITPEAERWLARRQIDSLLYIYRKTVCPPQRVYDRLWSIQRSALQEVVELLDGDGVPAIVFKGAEFLAGGYEPHSIGAMVDVDILVPRASIIKTKGLLTALGFRQASYDYSSNEFRDMLPSGVEQQERNHYELVPFSKVCDVAIEDEEVEWSSRRDSSSPLFFAGDSWRAIVSVDVHHGVAANIGGEYFLENAVSSAIGKGLAMRPADHVWLTVSRLYNEVALNGKLSLRDFAYVGPLISQRRVDWDIVLSGARRFRLASSLYYYLAFLSALSDGLIPREVVLALSPSKNGRSRDWGWQLSRLFDQVDPFPLQLPPLIQSAEAP